MEPLTLFHIVAGSAALAAGFAALAVRKGGAIHQRVGTIFFAAMLAMAGSGAVIALFLPERGTAAVGVLSCYLVATSWRTARQRSGEAGTFELVGLFVALGCAAAFLAVALLGMAEPDGRLDRIPGPFHFPFAAVALLAAALDLSFLRRGRLEPRQRIARHLWRMCAALFIAAMSFFLGQQDEFPQALQGLFVWTLLPLSILLAMVFWLIRLRFAKAWNRPRRPWRAPAPAAPAEVQ